MIRYKFERELYRYDPSDPFSSTDRKEKPAACIMPTFYPAYIFPKFVLCNRVKQKLPSSNTKNSKLLSNTLLCSVKCTSLTV